jgi:hypothetical protein
MTQLVAVAPETFRKKYWKRFESYEFAAKDSVAPLAAAEIARAAQAMPVAFLKQDDRFILAGLLSLTPGNNLYVGPRGRWLGEYAPSCFRGYPFRLAKAEGRDDLILCIDQDSELVSDEDGERFFDDQDQLAEPLQKVLDFLSRVQQNWIATQKAVDALAEAGLICDWPLKIKTSEGEQPVNGLFMIDEAKLNSLEDDLFLTLRTCGALPIAYAQMLSMGNIQLLSRLADARARQQAPVQNNVSGAFGDDDILTFDNL